LVRGERDGFLVASDGRKRRGANRIKVEEAATNNLEGEDEGKGTGQGRLWCAGGAGRAPPRHTTVDSIGPTRELCASWATNAFGPCKLHNGDGDLPMWEGGPIKLDRGVGKIVASTAKSYISISTY